MTTLPAEVEVGYAVGRFLIARADGPDADRKPDANAATGLKVKFTPVTTIRRATGEPVTIVQEPVECTVGADGWMRDPEGAQGVWLVEGRYKVTYTATGYTIPAHEITVTPAHTEAAPLDLTLAAPLIPSPAVQFVVNEQVYLDTIAARDDALAAAASIGQVVRTVNGVAPDENGDVVVSGGTGGTALTTYSQVSGLPDYPTAFPATAATVTDATTVGRNVLTAASQSAARTAIGAGTSNLTIGTTGSTAKAGNWAPAVADVTGLQATLDAIQATLNTKPELIAFDTTTRTWPAGDPNAIGHFYSAGDDYDEAADPAPAGYGPHDYLLIPQPETP